MLGDAQCSVDTRGLTPHCQIRSRRSSRSTSPDSAAESGSFDDGSSQDGGSVSSSKSTNACSGDELAAPAYIIRNTFIATIEDRDVSLEGFLQNRQAWSCPPTRAPSYELTDGDLPQVPNFSVNDADTSYIVRNTFIETSIGRPPSLEGFYEERQVSSCPPTRLTSVDEEQTLSHLLDGLNDQIDDVKTAGHLGCQTQEACHSAFELSRQHAEEPDKLVLLIHDALGMPEVGSDQLPSIGSREHSSGNCKPCAFFHARRCKSGEHCGFCHLCGPGEKKRRQRVKDEQVQAAKQQQQQQLLQPLVPQHQATPDAVFDSILQTLQQTRW